MLHLQPTYPYLSSCYHSTLHGLKATFCLLEEVTQNLEAVHKISQVALAIFQGYNLYRGRDNFSKFMQFLDTANVDDFYEILELPHTLFYTINAHRIDEYKLLDALEIILSKNWPRTEIDIRSFAKKNLQQLLEQMRDEERAYRHPIHFNKKLEKLLRTDLEQQINDERLQHTLISRLDLNALEIHLKPFSFIDLFHQVAFSMAMIGCVVVFLEEWEVIPHFSKIAEQIGRYSSWIAKLVPHIEQMATAALCVGFLAKFISAWKVFYHPQSTPNQMTGARYDLYVSAAECLFNLILLRRRDSWLAILSTIVAKSLGFWSALYKPEMVFFEAPLLLKLKN